MISVVTLLRGNAILTDRWAACWKNMPKPEGIQLYVGYNNDRDLQIAQELGATPIFTQPFIGNDEADRINFVADIYAMILPMVQGEHIILWEDDIVPPPDGINKLVANKDKAAGIVSITPFRQHQQPFPGIRMVMLYYKRGDEAVTQSSLSRTGLDKVFGGGTAFSIWNAEELRSTLPWHVAADEHGTVPGWDDTLSRRLEDAGKEIMVDYSISCYHG